MRPATAPQVGTQAVLLLVGGPAGAGKSTVATAWCHTRQRAVRIDLDQVRDLIVAGRADPQILTSLQVEQYELSVQACVALAHVFLAAGYDVALETVFEPEDFAQRWRPLLAGLAWHLVVLRPSLAATLARSRARAAHDALRAAGCREAFLFVHEQNERALAVCAAAGYRPDGSSRVSDFRGIRLRELGLVKQL